MRVPFCPPFLAGEPRATGLLPDRFRSRAAWREEVEARRGRKLAPALLRSLAARSRELPPSAARERNLDALAQPGTVAVVTGQQVGLFLGPLYTVYKAATAIAWAAAVERETGARCVPIFWLQTEDHDFAEIAGCCVPAPGEPPLKLSLPAVERRCSVAHVTLPPEVAGLVAALEGATSALPEAASILPLVRAAYQPGRPISAAFAHLLAAVFAEEGLVVLDPRCSDLAPLAAPINRAALEQADAIDAALLRRGLELEQAGLAEQVHVRSGSPLVFFHPEGSEGPRHRLQRAGAGFRLDSGAEVAIADVLAAAARNPLRLSTSALLRPIVQDALLPAVAYVGGPAEIGNLAQTAVLYPLFDVRPAMPVPRARFRLVDPRSATRLSELGLSAADVEVPREQLLEQLGAARAGLPSADEIAKALLAGMPDRIDALAAARPALDRAARRTRFTVERAAARFAARQARLIAAEDRTLAERIDLLQSILYPECTPQERVHSLPWFAARFGLHALKASIFAAIVPGQASVKDLTP